MMRIKRLGDKTPNLSDQVPFESETLAVVYISWKEHLKHSGAS